MNTEKIEKLKKGLTNSQIPETLREKIRQQISRLEAEDKANETPPKEETPKAEATPKKEPAPKKEKAPKKEPAPKVAKIPVVRKPREKKVVEPKAPTTGKNTAMALAKEIRKDGEKWTDAVKRASSQMKKGTKEIKKSTNTELKKLLALVKRRKELKGISGTNLKRDSQRKAKPKGRRVSENGNVYYENRDNRTDRLAPNYPKNAPLLAGGGALYSAYTDNPLKYLSLMGAKTHSDLNYSTTKNGIDYYIGIRKDKYDDNKAIVVAFITDENNYMIDKEDAKEMSETARQKGIDKVELYTNYGVELRSNQKPQTLGFDKIIKVSGNHELGGGIDATMTYDLAGATSGGTGGLNAGMPLSDVSGTNYTGLVGETGAMSAGEMFVGGGSLASKFDLAGFTIIAFFDTLKEAQAFTKMQRKNQPNFFTVVIKEEERRSKPFLVFSKIKKGKYIGNRVFQDGGGLPSGAMQSYVNNYLGEGTAQGIYENGGDLFENYNEQPEELAQIVNFYMEKFDEGDYDYEDSKNFLKEVEAIGYTFDYGLDNEPYNLRPIENEMKHGGNMHNYKKMEDNYANGGFMNNVYAGGGSVGDDYVLIEGTFVSDGDTVTFLVSKKELDKIPYETMEEKAKAFVDFFTDFYGEYGYNFKKLITDKKIITEYAEGYNHSNYKVILSDDEENNPEGFYITKSKDYLKFASGGGIRTVNGREYPTGRNWTNDHRQHNKLQNYEIPKNKRK